MKFVFIGLYKIKKCHSSTYIVGTLMSCALLNTNIIYLFVLFKHGCYMSIHVVYTWKSCTRFPCLNNAWHLCLNDTNPWNNKFCMDLEQTHEAYKFMMNSMWWIINEICAKFVHSYVRTIYAQIPCVEKTFDTHKCVDGWSTNLWMNGCHTNFASSNKYVVQMCFQYTILASEIYELWLNEFWTISIIKSWDAKFVMMFPL